MQAVRTEALMNKVKITLRKAVLDKLFAVKHEAENLESSAGLKRAGQDFCSYCALAR